jgi:predicted NAD/FAD-binding protein
MQANMQPSASMQAQQQSRRHTPRIAIIGGGISGIACSWNLQRHDCDLDIYEADDKLGGHANSVPFIGNGQSVDVDTGFIAMDESTYRKKTCAVHVTDSDCM